MRTSRTALAAVMGTGVVLVCGLLVAPASAQVPLSVQAASAPSSPHTAAAKKKAPQKYRVVARKLHNPRNLSITPKGDLYVAEAGSGGRTSDSCFVASAGANVCPGNTGSITKVSSGRHGWKQQRVVKGLPSLAPPPGSTNPQTGAKSAGTEASGPSDVLVHGKRYTAVIGFGAGCETEGSDTVCDPWSEHGVSKKFGAVITGVIGGSHRPRTIANVAKHEYATNPIDNPDSNPVSISQDGWSYFVADAGANTVDQVGPLGWTQTVAQFADTMVANPLAPPGAMVPMQFVPTDATLGPDGALYVSQLTGFPFPEGASTIWRIQRGHAPTEFATGLTNVTSMAFGPDGRLYVVETSSQGLLSGSTEGSLVRISRNGAKSTVIATGLPSPYGVAVRGHDAYVTVNSTSPRTGKVVQISLRTSK